MKYRDLGDTGIKVSEIGFGAWGIGGNIKGSIAYGPTDDTCSLAALNSAYDNGVTFYDTADFYGYGHSETLIGTAFKNRRSDIVIASKVGMVDANGPQDFSTKHILASIDDSLDRLQTDYIDLYQLHSPPIDNIDENNRIVSVLQDLKVQGKIREYGISLRSPEDGLKAIAQGFSVLQVNFNMIDQRAIESGVFDLCEKKRVGVISRTPLCFGFLTGSFGNRDAFGADDHRSKWSVEQIERWSNAYQLFVGKITLDKPQTHAQIALRFCLSHRCISSVIPGMLNTDEVLENTMASEFGSFEAEEITIIEKVYKDHNFYVKQP
jgi:aryl-alcohol dehydrogenase-like predicted oxidoreductase